MDDSPLSLAAYLEWKDSAGFDGDHSLCWSCWCHDRNNNDPSIKDVIEGRTKTFTDTESLFKDLDSDQQ